MFSLAKHSRTQKFRAEVWSGLRLTARWLFFFFWLILIFGGLGTISSAEGRFPLFVGWLSLVIAAVIALATMERWIKVLPGFLACGVLNGVYMVVTGHLVNDASKRIPLETSMAMTLLGAGSVVVAGTLASRKPTLVDRLAAFGVFVSLVIGIENERLTVLSFSLMFCCLVAAWGAERVRQRWRMNAGRRRRREPDGVS